LNIFQKCSLKSRVTLFTLAIFLASSWTLATYASRVLRDDMQRLLGEQQYSTVSFIAAEVNYELNDRLKMLARVAENVSPALLDNTAALQALLERQAVLQDQFSGGVIAYRLDGTAIAELPHSAKRIGINYMEVDAVASALKEGKATIGQPVMGKKPPTRIFTMAVPIRNAQDRVIGALGGVINLGMPGFLNKITDGRYAQTGGYLLITPQHRLIVTPPQVPHHGSASSRCQTVARPVHSGLKVPILPPIQRAWKCWLRANAFRRLLAMLPTAEAFARFTPCNSAYCCHAIFHPAGGRPDPVDVKTQLAPMLAASKTLATQSETNQPPQPLPITRRDEIGHLLGGFNRLLKSLAQREDALKKSEERFRNFFENNSSVMLLIEPSSGKIIEANSAAANYYGYPAAVDPHVH
jgi:PAS domain-containing protein